MRLIHTIDAHTAGEPVRIVTSGIPVLRGGSAREKRDDFAHRFDHLRAAILHEPRGHRDMFGAVLVPPDDGSDVHFAVFFMDNGGYLDMCGHGLIGVVTALLHQGVLDPGEYHGVVRCDTPAGLVTCQVREKRPFGAVVAFRSVPSFAILLDEEIVVDGIGSVLVDVAYGGNLTAIIDADRLGLELTVSALPRLIRFAGLIAPAVEARLRELDACPPGMERVALIEFSSRKAGPQAHMKNVTVFGDGQVDRSPCGTGTCAKMAVLAAKGELPLEADFRHEGILGTVFRGRLVERVEVDGRTAVVPEVEGESWLTGFHQFVIPEGDPLRSGFLL